MRIMIVDDEADITNLTGIIFELYGHETIKTYSSEECLKKLEEGKRPDVILLDVMMPEISGYDVCRRIKSDSRLNTIPVIILSAKIKEEDIAEGYRAGADGYITKPFDPDVLVRQVIGYVKK
jgi:CheY-like chemotaxis protein